MSQRVTSGPRPVIAPLSGWCWQTLGRAGDLAPRMQLPPSGKPGSGTVQPADGVMLLPAAAVLHMSAFMPWMFL